MPGPRNKAADLSNLLFEQIERLNDDSLTKEELELQIAKSKAITSVSTQIISLGNLALKAEELRKEYGEDINMPVLLGSQDEV